MTDFEFLKTYHLFIHRKENVSKTKRVRQYSQLSEILVPRGHVTVSGDIFGCPTCPVSLASSGQGPAMLLNIL